MVPAGESSRRLSSASSANPSRPLRMVGFRGTALAGMTASMSPRPERRYAAGSESNSRTGTRPMARTASSTSAARRRAESAALRPARPGAGAARRVIRRSSSQRTSQAVISSQATKLLRRRGRHVGRPGVVCHPLPREVTISGGGDQHPVGPQFEPMAAVPKPLRRRQHRCALGRHPPAVQIHPGHPGRHRRRQAVPAAQLPPGRADRTATPSRRSGRRAAGCRPGGARASPGNRTGRAAPTTSAAGAARGEAAAPRDVA